MIMSKETLIKSIREVPDFPIPGILFYDVTTLFKDPWCLQELSNIMFDMYKDKIMVINLSGRGDKDVYQIARYRGVDINE